MRYKTCPPSHAFHGKDQHDLYPRMKDHATAEQRVPKIIQNTHIEVLKDSHPCGIIKRQKSVSVRNKENLLKKILLVLVRKFVVMKTINLTVDLINYVCNTRIKSIYDQFVILLVNFFCLIKSYTFLFKYYEVIIFKTVDRFNC